MYKIIIATKVLIFFLFKSKIIIKIILEVLSSLIDLRNKYIMINLTI